MPTMLVTCPESAHLEEVEFDVHPLGMLIRSCSALRGSCAACPATCAARLDRRRATGDPRLHAFVAARSCLRR